MGLNYALCRVKLEKARPSLRSHESTEQATSAARTSQPQRAEHMRACRSSRSYWQSFEAHQYPQRPPSSALCRVKLEHARPSLRSHESTEQATSSASKSRPPHDQETGARGSQRRRWQSFEAHLLLEIPPSSARGRAQAPRLHLAALHRSSASLS